MRKISLLQYTYLRATCRQEQEKGEKNMIIFFIYSFILMTICKFTFVNSNKKSLFKDILEQTFLLFFLETV